MRTVMAIDPGSDKCGVAVVSDAGVLHRQVVPRADAVQAASSLADEFEPDCILVGDGTGGTNLAEEVRGATSYTVRLVDESLSTRKARARFFRENPPRGIRRLIPQGLLTPNRPYDDYVATILAEEYLNRA